MKRVLNGEPASLSIKWEGGKDAMIDLMLYLLTSADYRRSISYCVYFYSQARVTTVIPSPRV